MSPVVKLLIGRLTDPSIRYLFISDSHLGRIRGLALPSGRSNADESRDHDGLFTIFPNLRLHVTLTIQIGHSSDDVTVIVTKRNAMLDVHRPVSVHVLHDLLAKSWVRFLPVGRWARLCRLDEVTRITCHDGAWITHEEHFLPTARYRNRTHKDLQFIVGSMPVDRLQTTLSASFPLLPREASSKKVMVRCPTMRLDMFDSVCEKVSLSRILVRRLPGSHDPASSLWRY